jgi:transcriptional regulator
MYLPPHFQVTEPAKLVEAMRRYSFATLITHADGAPFATHLPLIYREQPRTPGTLIGHVARANPQWQHFAAGAETLAIFHGPHAYVSPSWYATELAVPTWNYIAIHAYGVPRVIDDEAWVEALVDELVQIYESSQPQPWANQLPREFKTKLLKAIVGFEMPLTRIEGKFKLSQNRPPDDVAGVIAALNGSPHADGRAIAEAMQ